MRATNKLWFCKKPRGYWNDPNNVQVFLNKLREDFNLQNEKDWNSITSEQIINAGGSTLLSSHYSLYDIKCLGFPKGKKTFTSTKFFKYWDNENRIKLFLDELKTKYNLNTAEDWNSITSMQIKLMGGKRLLNKYSLYEIKCMGFPEGNLKFNKPINRKSKEYWNKKENLRLFLLQLTEKFNLKTKEDWNSLSTKQVKAEGGSKLLNMYTLFDIKCMGCPDVKLIVSKRKPPGYWDNIENVKQFLNELKIKYNLNTVDDWNLINSEKIYDFGGKQLLTKYSIYELKCIACPEGNLIFSKSLPKGYWDNNENIQNFLSQLKEKLDLKTIEDWKRLSIPQIWSYGGKGLTSKFSKSEIIEFAISHFYDKNQIELHDLNSNSKASGRSSQRLLFLQIQKLFPHDEIVEDYYHSEISRETGSAVQFDIFLIHKKIAIEYHGQQHYEDIPSAFAPLELYKNRDKEKEKLCIAHGIQLIIIPYWWDNNINSLAKTINSKINNK